MKGSSYRDRDYAFGQAMLTLRMAIGLTQAGLARHLGVSRKAVGEWEVGLTYPKAENLKALIALAVQQQAYPLGREAHVWDVTTGIRRWVGRGQSTRIRRVAWSPDGTHLASCGDDNTIQVWDLESTEYLRSLRRDRPYERLNITGIWGLSEAQKVSLRSLGAIEDVPLPGTQHAP